MLEYKIIFDPHDTWSNRNSFESDLSAWFRARGLKAENVDMADSDRPHIRMLLVSPDEKVMNEEPKEQTPQQLKRNLTAKRTRDGKFQK